MNICLDWIFRHAYKLKCDDPQGLFKGKYGIVMLMC